MNRVTRELPNHRREHRLELSARLLALRERPRLTRLHELVAASAARHHTLESFVKQESAVAVHRGVEFRQVDAVSAIELTARTLRYHRVAILLDHRDRATRQV